MKKYLRLSICTGLCSMFAMDAHAATLYAKVGGGSAPCTGGWSTACSLPNAITAASSGDSIWVQQGTYSPIGLKNGVKIIGGFDGTETSASQSDPVANETILDGGGTDQVVFSNSDAGSTVLRGFTISNGWDSEWDGGGGAVLEDSSALFVQCVFKNNLASKFGGAVVVRGASSAQFINCTFYDNGTDNGTPSDNTDDKPLGGGAVYVYKGTPTFTNCLFYNNVAGEGAAILVMFGAPTLTNCTVADNRATIGSGGGVFDQEGTAQIRNSIVWNNSAVRAGDQIYTGGSGTTVIYSDIQGGWSGTGNINSDPLFTNSASGDYTIGVSSPCMNAANNADIPTDAGDLDWDSNTAEDVPYDLAGNGRTSCTNLDMGAYEWQDTGPVRACCFGVVSCANVTQCECDVLNGTWNPNRPCKFVNCGGGTE